MSHHGGRDRPDDVVVVARYHHRHQAELARGFLEEAGIRAAVTADDGGGSFGVPLAFSRSGFATVRVRREDVERARKVLRQAGMDGG